MQRRHVIQYRLRMRQGDKAPSIFPKLSAKDHTKQYKTTPCEQLRYLPWPGAG